LNPLGAFGLVTTFPNQKSARDTNARETLYLLLI